jgi:hypothetical protein
MLATGVTLSTPVQNARTRTGFVVVQKGCHRRGCSMHSTKVSKESLVQGRLSRYDSAKRQIAMSLVDGARSLRCAYDLDRAGERNCRLYETENVPMTWPRLALCTSSAHHSSGKRLLVVIGEDLDLKRCADSTLLVPADGAGGPPCAEVPAELELDPMTGGVLDRRRSACLCPLSSKPALRRNGKWRQNQ